MPNANPIPRPCAFPTSSVAADCIPVTPPSATKSKLGKYPVRDPSGVINQFTLFSLHQSKQSEITSYSFLSKQYRGPIPDLIYNIDVELFNKEQE